MIPATDDLILVTGGNGFIGSHVVRRFLDLGNRVRVVDVVAEPSLDIQGHPRLEVLAGDLCQKSICSRAVKGVHTVLHFAANMGGMGVIHCDNDLKIYAQNHLMTLNVFSAASTAGVKQFMYASSACVYPQSLQASTDTDVSLREGDVWMNPPPRPQGLYGLEKLSTEMLLAQQTTSMVVRISRFHNVYGPGGAWNGGREKAPAALLRKAIAAKLQQPSRSSIEVWGDGKQRRSFLWIGDCVDAIMQLLNSSCAEPVNIGSDEAVSIQNLAELALKCVELDPAQIDIRYDASCTKLVGVASRNSNNEFPKRELSWEHTTPLEVGMKWTAEWIEGQIAKQIESCDQETARRFLEQCMSSQVIDLDSESPIFAILLPVTSRGSASESDCLSNLQSFVASLARTTAEDVFSNNAPFRLRVYVAIDRDDIFLLPTSGFNKVEAILRQNGITDISTSVCSFPRGHVCSLWRHLAFKAWEEECSYFVLMGDDVVLEDEGWMSSFHAAFARMAASQGVPLGFGCIAFTDRTFPGMPTFPVVHRTHLDIFSGTVVPEAFVNQDGDPFLFQLYRRWGSSTMIEARLSNRIGGSNDARYEKIRSANWTFQILQDGISVVEGWLRKEGSSVEQKLTLDIIVPCYRVQLNFLGPILGLESSPTCSVSTIIIVDNPDSPNIAELEKEYARRPDVRIRVNSRNMGASFSRNRGLAEATAKWVLFLDDDVMVDPDLLFEAENAIRAHPEAAGFVGHSWFPPADTIFTAAIHLSGMTWFWNVAQKIDSSDLPWGVTANLIARRDLNDGVKFDLSFPKTGGGEDIDFCRKKRDASIAAGNRGFFPAPQVRVTHPWWSGGKRSYWRFYMWGQGDGGLIRMYPELTYRDFPNSAELLACAILSFVAAVFRGSPGLSIRSLKYVFGIILANIVHDCYRHLYRDSARTLEFKTKLTRTQWISAVAESALLRMASEGGRTVGVLKRGEVRVLGKRFDWFAGTMDSAVKEERIRGSAASISLINAFFRPFPATPPPTVMKPG
ncbi:NAD-dependent epimerase/dehydratase [Mycena rosella]|uniref:NAD-dependent epimerase/dehydratase n=1 Tax=Mycena rosella TaxID=1033263 RepID=A0AAD7D084_MYCRO|nr:NAD-dependent epimerase/dehydratase [Mycena rosella]